MPTWSRLVLTALLFVMAGCGGPAPTAPTALVPSVAAWTHAGLTCAGPTPSGTMAGLLAWTCSGTLHGAAVTAALDGDAQGVFLASVSLAAATEHTTTVAVFADLADAMPAYASARPQVHAWIEAWAGGVDGATFGTTSVAIAPVDTIGTASEITLYITGPRKNLGDPMP
jgi:hypothetical protein